MNCVFCKIISGEIPCKKLYEDELVLVIMDINPSVDGHVLIIPKKHYTDYLELDDKIILHIFNVSKKLGPIIMDKLNAKSMSMLINYGDDQQVKHFHMHLLPDFGTKESKASKKSDEIFRILKN